MFQANQGKNREVKTQHKQLKKQEILVVIYQIIFKWSRSVIKMTPYC